MDMIFVDIMTREILSSIKVTTSFIGQFFSSSRRGRDGVKGVDEGYRYVSQLGGTFLQSRRKNSVSSE